MNTNFFMAAIVILPLFSPLNATAEDCADLARVISRESERFADKNQVDILNTANLCSAEYDKATNEQQAQIDASYGMFSGGAKGSSGQVREMQKQRCENKYGSEWRNRITSNEIQRVSQAGADVVKACLNSRSFRLVGLTIADEALGASFRYSGIGEIVLSGIIVTPPEIAKCSVLYNGKTITNLAEMPGVSIKSGETIALDCKRLSAKIGEDRENYKGGLIGIATSEQVAQVPLIAYSSPPLYESTAESLSRQIAELKEKYISLKKTGEAHETEIFRLKKQITEIYKALSFGYGTRKVGVIYNGPDDGGAVSPKCPSGSVMTGVRHSGYNYENGEIDCVVLKPADVP